MSLDARMQSIWYSNSRVAWLLLPLSGLFACVIALRRWLYRSGWLQTIKVKKPVIVVGNLSVGGTGKTPLVVWLANTLTSHGYKVAVIARGYRGAASSWPQVVNDHTEAKVAGDEPVLIAQQTGVIVIAGPDRVADAEHAIQLGADIIISDDGLQHYQLHRNCEIAVMDGSRMLGNGYLLPAGPLRESPARLRHVDLLLINRRDNNAIHSTVLQNSLQFRVVPTRLRSLKTGEQRSLRTLHGQQVHVVTGIGNPHAFITALRAQGIKVLPRVLEDHARFTQRDLQFGDALPVLMTVKDAVKCSRLDAGDNCWMVDAEAVLDNATAAAILDRIQATIQKSS